MNYEFLFPWLVFAYWIVSVWIVNADQEGKIFKIIRCAYLFVKKLPIIWPILNRNGNSTFTRKHHVQHRQRQYLTFAAFPTSLPSHYLLLLKKHSNFEDLEPVSDRKIKLFFLLYFLGDFFSFCSYNIQHCFICRPSDSTVPTDAGIELNCCRNKPLNHFPITV